MLHRNTQKEEQIKQGIVSLCSIGQTIAIMAKQNKVAELLQFILSKVTVSWSEIDAVIQMVYDIVNIFHKPKQLAIN